MKKRLILLILSVIMILALASCGKKNNDKDNTEEPGAGDVTPDTPGAEAPGTTDTPGTPDTPGTGDSGATDTPSTPDDGVIAAGYSAVFSDSVDVTVKARTIRQADDKEAYLIYEALGKKKYDGVYIVNSKDTASGNVIVIGESSDEISTHALELLRARLKREIRSSVDEDKAIYNLAGYAIYSSGGSVAIVWATEQDFRDIEAYDAESAEYKAKYSRPEYDFRVEEIAVNYFIENYILGSSLVLRDGYIRTEVFEMDRYLADRADSVKAESWDKFAAQIPEEYRETVVNGLKGFYNLFTPDVITWLANLYDPETGLFYCSNSVRDNYGYGPNIEDTQVALSFLLSSGAGEMRGDWLKILTPQQIETLTNTVYNMQDENGFFYHPQWPKEMIEEMGAQSRITRDLSMAKYFVKRLGIQQKYPYPDDAVEEVTPMAYRSASAAASKVVAVSALPQFESIEAFQVEMDAMEQRVLSESDPDQRAFQFYWVGNRFQSLTTFLDGKGGSAEHNALELKQRDMLIAFFDKYQNPETGSWSDIICYNATNALHKITAVYNNLGVPFKYADKMMETTIAVLSFNMEDEARTAINGVDIYNAWSVFNHIYENVLNYGEGSIDERQARCQEYKNRLYAISDNLIDYTTRQIARAKHDDGSFSYALGGYGGTMSMGLKVRPASVSEGDINGNAMAMLSTARYIILGLGLSDAYMPLFFTEQECNTFVNILRQMEATVKSPPDVEEEKIYTFEDYAVGDVPVEYNINYSGNLPNVGHTIGVIDSKTKYGKVFQYVGAKRQGDSGTNGILKLQVPNNALDANVAIFEMDMYFDGEGCDRNRQIIESTIKDTRDSKVIHRLSFITSNDRILLHNSDGVKIADIGGFDEVINFRFEYYFVEGAYKLYINGKLTATGKETYNMLEHQAPGYITIRTSPTINSKFWMDNINFRRVEKSYVDPTRELLPAKIFNFNRQTLDSTVTVSGDYGFSELGANNYALESGGATITVQPNKRSPIDNAAALGFDISTALTGTELSTLKFYNSKGTLLWQLDVESDENGNLCLQNDRVLPTAISTGVSLSAGAPLRVEALYGVGVGRCDSLLRIYLGDELIGESLAILADPTGDPKIAYAVIESLTDSAVIYDNLYFEKTVVDYVNDRTYDEVTPGVDNGRYDFEDVNVGALPDRITGAGVVSSELDGSNRFLQIVDNSRTDSLETVINMYQKDRNANSTVIEFDLEYLTSVSGILHSFVLVDSKGNEESVFYLKEDTVTYSLAIRPYTSEAYQETYHTSNPDKWPWSAPTSNLDADPAIVTRENYLAGKLTGKAGPSSKVTILMEIDWKAGTVTFTFNERYNTFYKQYGKSVYRTSLKDIAALKIVSSDFGMSVLNIDNLKAVNYYASSVTENTSPAYSFEETQVSAKPNGYIANGALVNPANGSVEYSGSTDRYLDIVGQSVGANPSVLFPVYKAPEITANKAKVILDIELDSLSESDSLRLALLDEDGEPVVGISLYERDGKIQMLHYDGYFNTSVRPVYLGGDFSGGSVPIISTSAYEQLDPESTAGLMTRFTLVIEYNYATGIFSVTIPGASAEPIYSAIAMPVTDISSFKLSVVSSTEADVNLYFVSAEALYDPAIESVTTVEPSVKDFESGYTESTVEWDCTNSSLLGDKHQSATDIYTEDGVKVLFNGGSLTPYANTNGTTASIESESGNHFLKIKAPMRNSDLDREYYVMFNTESCVAGEVTAYVYEMSFRISSAKKSDFLRIRLANGNDFVYIATECSGDNVVLNGITLGKYNEWIDLKLEYYPEEELMQVYVGGEYKGDFITTNSETRTVDGVKMPRLVSSLKGAITDVTVLFANSTNDLYGGFEVDFDNMKLYTSNKEYEKKSNVVKFMVDGEQHSILSVMTDKEIAIPKLSDTEDYRFIGWFVDKEFTIPFTKDYFGGVLSSEALEVYAKLELIEKIKVTFVSDGGVYYEDEFAVGTMIGSLPQIEKDGYDFIGWRLEDGTFVENKYIVPSEDITLYAEFEFIVMNNLTFIANGEEYHTVNMRNNGEVTFPDAPEKWGHEFAGWFVDEECTVRLTSDYFVENPMTEDTAVYAKFVKIVKPDRPMQEIPEDDDIISSEDTVAPGLGSIDEWLN